MTDFFAMGGYAGYVWGSYLLTAVVLATLFIGAQRGLRRRQRELEALRAIAPHRRGRRRGPEAVRDGIQEEKGT